MKPSFGTSKKSVQFLSYLATWVTRVKTKMRALCQLMHTHENNVGICEELKSCNSYPIGFLNKNLRGMEGGIFF